MKNYIYNLTNARRNMNWQEEVYAAANIDEELERVHLISSISISSRCQLNSNQHLNSSIEINLAFD